MYESRGADGRKGGNLGHDEGGRAENEQGEWRRMTGGRVGKRRE